MSDTPETDEAIEQCSKHNLVATTFMVDVSFKLERQRDELRKQLTAKDARIAEMREALQMEIDCYDEGDQMLTSLKVLSHPDDPTALKEREAQVLEEAAIVFQTEADRQRKEWEDFLAEKRDGPATSFHRIYEGIADQLRRMAAKRRKEEELKYKCACCGVPCGDRYKMDGYYLCCECAA